MHKSIPPSPISPLPGLTPGISTVFALDGKFLGVGSFSQLELTDA